MADRYTAPQWDRAALLTVDVQEDFGRPGSATWSPDKDRAVPAVAGLADLFRREGLPVVHIVRLYRSDGSNADPCRRQRIESGHRIVEPGTDGAEIVAALKPSSSARLDAGLLLGGGIQAWPGREWVIYKPRWGSFYATPLEGHLRVLGVTTLVVCGFNFPNCPRATIYEATERDFRVVMVRDGVSGLYERGIEEIRNIGVAVIAAEEVAAAVRGNDRTKEGG
jgi:nicotinamidase-related amidase